MLLPFLMVVGLPLVSILAAFFLVQDDHSWSSLAAFLLSILLLMLLMNGFGVNPLGFFVSPGGWLLFALLAFVVAVIVRLTGMLWDRWISA